jgi:NodT family efflux transporter outer membrane factor (OMF) lipoprotein
MSAEFIRRSGLPASLLLAASIALSGCAVGPNYHRPTAPAPPSYKEGSSANATVPPPQIPNGGWKTAQPSDGMLKGNWWEVYNDSQLNTLEEKLTIGNQTIKSAVARYLEAREQVRVARADYYPTVSAGPSVSRTKQSTNRALYSSTSTVPKTYNDLTLAGQVSWEPDVWGRVRRTVEASGALAQASAADLANIELSIRAELALDYFELRGLDLQKQLLDNTVVAFEHALDLTERRFHSGVATASDVALAQTQLETTRGQAIDVTVARSQFEHAVAMLIGVPASEFSLPPAPLMLNLPDIPTGIPSQLLERRPDIAAAERRAAAANAQIGIAVSAYYPTIQLTGTGGFESDNPGTWIQGPSALWSLGGSAVELLFDAGRRKALTRQARDNYDSSVADYRQSVLAGFQEVEDQLAALRILEQEAATERNAVAAAEHSLTLSTSRYKGGVASYLEVLTSENALLQNQRTEADVLTRRFSASVQLVRSLGGGWDTTQLAKP